MGKSGPNATFNLFCLGLGWPWVGEFVGFIIFFICFPAQQNLISRKHPRVRAGVSLGLGSESGLRLGYGYGSEELFFHLIGSICPLVSATPFYPGRMRVNRAQ